MLINSTYLFALWYYNTNRVVETRIHFNQLCYVGKSTDGALKLALDELPKDVQCFNFQFFRERKILGGSIYKIVSSPDDVGFARLEDSEMGDFERPVNYVVIEIL